VTVRHAVLPIGAVLVLGFGVYLFVEVRAQPSPLPPSSATPTTAIDRGAASVPQHVPAPVPVVDAPAPGVPPRQAVVVPGPGAETSRDAPPGAPADAELPLAGAKLDAVMADANKAYDHGDFDDAKGIAGRVLAKFPSNVRMLRIMVSASCIDGDSAVAQAHYVKLPPGDQAQMKVRCARYGVVFADAP